MLAPTFETFKKEFLRGKNQVVFKRITADLDTAVSLMLKLTNAKKNTFLLESVTGGEVKGRYSIIGMDPDLVWECFGEKSRLKKKKNGKFSRFSECVDKPLIALRKVIANSKISLPQGLPHMSSGLFGYLGYDIIRLVEDLPKINKDSLSLPDAVMMRPEIIVIIDNVKGELIIVTPVWQRNYKDSRSAYESAKTRIKTVVKKMESKIKTVGVKENQLN